VLAVLDLVLLGGSNVWLVVVFFFSNMLLFSDVFYLY
jgi:hypothetical protein